MTSLGALLRAQRDLIRGSAVIGDGDGAIRGDWSHPFHWAAFELIGDWK